MKILDMDKGRVKLDLGGLFPGGWWVSLRLSEYGKPFIQFSVHVCIPAQCQALF